MKPKKMNDNKHDYWKQGYLLALENSRRLNKIANLSAEAGEFCTGCSLNILAAEEAVKSAILFSKYSLPEDYFEIEDNEFNKIFTDHKTKLEHLKIITMINKVSIKEWEHPYDQAKPLLEKLETLPFALQKEFREKYDTLFKIPHWIERLKKNELIMDRILKWWDSSRIDKNSGFYVGKGSNGIWDDPKIFTKEKFDESEICTIGIIEYIEILKEFDELRINFNLDPFK